MRACVLLLKDGHTEETHDLVDIVHNKVVHYPFRQHDPVPDAIAAMGCVLPRGSRLDGHRRYLHHLGVQK